NLEVTGFFHETGKDSRGPIDVMHVFARSAGAPPEHFYRRRENSRWTAWETVKLDIQDGRVMPFVMNGRLRLFWPVIVERSDDREVTVGKNKSDDELNERPRKYLDIQIAWSDYRNGQWTPRRMAPEKCGLATGGKDILTTQALMGIDSSANWPT